MIPVVDRTIQTNRIINTGNSNGKTPFHSACQLRDSVELCETLMEQGADFDATTRRWVNDGDESGC